MGWFWAWNGCPVLEPFLVFVYRVVRLMTRLGGTLEISSNPMGPVMLCYLESLNSSIDSLQSVGVVREYPTPRRGIDFRIIWLVIPSQFRGRLGT